MEKYEIKPEAINEPARRLETAVEPMSTSPVVDPLEDLMILEDMLWQFPPPEPWQDWESDPIVKAIESKRLALAGQLMESGALVLCGACYADELMTKYQRGEFDYQGRRPAIDRLVQVTYCDFQTNEWDRNQLYIYREPFPGEVVAVTPAVAV